MFNYYVVKFINLLLCCLRVLDLRRFFSLLQSHKVNSVCVCAFNPAGPNHVCVVCVLRQEPNFTLCRVESVFFQYHQ